ncbi:MAG: hypothetical protein Q9161_001999 [Pseudevernia consocians]
MEETTGCTTFKLGDKAPESEDSQAKKDASLPKPEGPSTSKDPPMSTNPKAKRATCKKHAKDSKKKTKKHSKAVEPDSSSDSDDSSSDSSSSSSSSDYSDSSSEEDEAAKKKRKSKAKKAKKLKAKKRAKAKAKAEETDSDSDDESSSEEEEKKRNKRKKKLKKKKRAKKSREVEEDEEDEEDDDDDDGDAAINRQKLAQLQALSLKRVGRGRVGRGSIGEAVSISGELGKTSAKAKGKPGKRGSKVDFVRVDRIWDSNRHNYVLKATAEDPDLGEYDQFAFHVRRIFDWENKYINTVLDIKSKALKEALKDVMDEVKGVSFAEETPVIDPNMIFLYLEEIRTHMKKLKKKSKTETKKEKKNKKKFSATTKTKHLKVLLKYLDKDYAETKKTLYPLLENNTITFDLLWALFKSNEIAYCPTYGNPDEPRAFKIEYANLHSSYVKGKYYNVEGRYLEYDGKTFGMGSMEIEVEEFKGPRKISNLACFPLKYHKDANTMRKQLIERGKKFVSLKGMQYKFHKGMAFYKKKRQYIKVNINGRIMVDPAIHRRINPNYPISTVKAGDPDILDDPDDEFSDADSCADYQQSSSDEEGTGQQPGDQFGETDRPVTKYKLIKDEDDKYMVVEVEVDAEGNELRKEDIEEIPGQEATMEREFTEEEFLIASPVVLGFAFSEKLWLEFSVSGINEIDWNEGAFDSLVLPDNQKAIVKALVESHTFEASRNIDDVIQGKGRGLVAVLHGPPGTGKTLTAEGIAELLKRPLYMVSTGELGTRPDQLETELNKILDVAHSWGAVLLLDEADVFLEARQPQDVARNALVSIFLRLLEYFQGILFLTTNRVETFDPAFQSRIHVALRYGELNTKAKNSVWKTFLGKVKAIGGGVEVDDFSNDDYDRLARRNLNGRQIKNAVRTAQALAVNEKKPLGMEHIIKVLDVAETFERDLKGGPGYVEAMRSYH